MPSPENIMNYQDQLKLECCGNCQAKIYKYRRGKGVILRCRYRERLPKNIQIEETGICDWFKLEEKN